MEDVTTIKIQRSTKCVLEQLKHGPESYDEVVRDLVLLAKTKSLKEELIKAYKEMGERDVKIIEEWDNSSRELED
ncbi:MAG TPA: hypothetical protein VJH95_04110 [Candidatus Nanoarchaeia archaeon]|nr:hypothetical protein [Candidatus Nanoarchaeia archaeon]